MEEEETREFSLFIFRSRKKEHLRFLKEFSNVRLPSKFGLFGNATTLSSIGIIKYLFNY